MAKFISSDFTKNRKLAKTPVLTNNIEKSINDLKPKDAGEFGDYNFSKNNKELKIMTSEVTKIAKESRNFLSRANFVMKSIVFNAARATQSIAKSSADAVSQYTDAIKEDININKRNFMATMVGQASPILGYFSSKILETDIFKKFTGAAKEKLGSAFRKIGGFLRSKKRGMGGIGSIEDEEELIQAARLSSVGPPKLKRHSPAVLEIPIEKEKPKGLEETADEERKHMYIYTRTATIRGDHITLSGRLEKAVQEEQTKIFEKFSNQFGEFSKKQEEQWSMFAWSITGGPPKKGSSFMTDFRTYFSRLIFPAYKSVQDQMLENLIAIKTVVAGKEKKVGIVPALFKSLMFVYKRTTLYRRSLMFYNTIAGILKPIYNLSKFTLKTLWTPFKWFFFKRFKKFGPESYSLPTMKKGSTPAQYSVQLLGALYQGTMFKFDELIHYIKLIGGSLGAEMKPFKKPGFTLYDRFLRPLVSKLGTKLIGPIATKSVTELLKTGFKKTGGFLGRQATRGWNALWYPWFQPRAGTPLTVGAGGMTLGERPLLQRGLSYAGKGLGLAGRGIGGAWRFTTGLISKVRSLSKVQPKSFEEALVLYTGKTTNYLQGIYTHYKEKSRKEKLEALREKAKTIWEKIKKIASWVLTGLKNIINWAIKGIGPLISKSITPALITSMPLIVKGVLVGLAGAGGYWLGHAINKQIDNVVKRLTGEENLGAWLGEKFFGSPKAGTTARRGRGRARSIANVAKSYAETYKRRMSSEAYNLMDIDKKTTIADLVNQFSTLRSSGAIVKEGGKWITLEEKISEREKHKTNMGIETPLVSEIGIPFTTNAKSKIREIQDFIRGHISPEATARISTELDRLRQDQLKEIWKEYSEKTGETWEDFKKKFGPMINQSTQSVIQNTRNISNIVQQQAGNVKDVFDQNMDKLISNDIL